MPIAFVVHAGAWAIPDDQVAPHRAACRAALAAGWAVLSSGGTALAACEAAVRLLEDDPSLNAGTGAVLNYTGAVELDAAIMDGSTLAYGAVANLRRIRNPITLARHVLQGPATLLAAAGAEQFAVAQGIALCENHELVVERERKLWEQWRAGQSQPADDSTQSVGGHETVGAVALDAAGNLVAANSTGGTSFKLPGRIGDTPLVGCGLYADNQAGACVCTGWGESITRLALARQAVTLLESGLPPQSAAEYAVRKLAHRVAGGSGGCLLLSRYGQVGVAWNTPRLAYAYRVADGPVIDGI